MTEQISVNQVLPKDAVTAVREESPVERQFRMWGDFLIRTSAIVLVIVAFAAMLYIILKGSYVDKDKENAWNILLTIIATLIGFLFGSRSK